MLTALSIRDIVLIEKLDLDLEAGLSVLTGETGAGKSILLDSLGLALGARGDAGLVRAGVEQGSVTAAFYVPDNAIIQQMLEEAGVEPGDELVLRRVQKSSGASRALVNDQPVSVTFLKSLGMTLCEIHGQHEARALVDVGGHRRLLDAYGGLEDKVRKVGALWADLASIRAELDSHRAKLAKAEAEQAFLEHAVAELRELAPEDGEEAKLADTRQMMMNSEGFSSLVENAQKAMEGDGTLEAKLNSALRKLEMRREEAGGRFDDVCKALERVVVEMNEARMVLESAAGRFEFNADVLENAETRLFALRALARKHKVMVDELPQLLTRFEADLEAIESGEQRLTELEQREKAAVIAYMEKARVLSTARCKSASRLDKAVMAELGPLRLEKARFETQVLADEEKAGLGGIDRVEFVVATNPGAPVAPMIKVASGGELSRFMLALKVVLAACASAPTLIFDEIDTGVGGAVADAIGKRLGQLSKELQVLTITHSPQVAARADDHMLISKISEVGEGDERAVTRVTRLVEGAKREEIARMLSGAEITNEARAQADQLMTGGQ